MFFYLEDGEEILCRNYMQLFIEGADEDSEAQEGIIIPPGPSDGQMEIMCRR